MTATNHDPENQANTEVSERHLRMTHFDDNPPHAKSIRCTCGDAEFATQYDWAIHRSNAFAEIVDTLRAELAKYTEPNERGEVHVQLANPDPCDPFDIFVTVTHAHKENIRSD
jgi:hypothetical protein